MALNLKAQILSLRTALEAALTATGERTGSPSVPWTPGQRLAGQVEAELPGGRHQIRVGMLQFDVQLPLTAKVGDPLRLEFISGSPRIAFALLPDGGTEAVPPGRTPQVEISAAGRTLAHVLQAEAVQRPPAGSQPAPLRVPAPLLPAPPQEGAPLAAALQRAVDGSGLFYESHLVQWFAGERPLAAIVREPQGRLSSPTTLADAELVAQASREDVAPKTARNPVPASTAPPAGQGQQRDPAQATSEQYHPQALALIRHQLDLLEHRQILWQGQAWPGQNLEWRIDEPPERAPSSGEAAQWSTHLRLTLPRLGEVRADLSLLAGRVTLRLGTDSPRSMELLRTGQAALAHALEDAGLALQGFVVRADDAA